MIWLDARVGAKHRLTDAAAGGKRNGGSAGRSR